MGKIVLFIDDDDDFITLLDYRFKNEEFKLIFASSGKEALELIKNKKIDLLILDRRLPDIEGDEVIAKLRADPKTKSLPIILISGMAKGDESKISDQFFLKPFDWDKLKSSIYKLLKEKVNG